MILCVDPDPDALAATRDTLADAGYETATAGTLADARDVLDDVEAATLDALVTEYELPEGTGLDVVRAVREHAPDVACVVFTSTPVESVDTAAFGDVSSSQKNWVHGIACLVGSGALTINPQLNSPRGLLNYYRRRLSREGRPGRPRGAV